LHRGFGILCLSQTTGYAILALSCLDGCGDRWILAKEIADRTSVPQPYLSKILHALGRRDLVEAKRGYRGGFRLAKSGSQITLLDIADAVEGEAWSAPCLLGLEECSDERACSTHRFWSAERKKIENELRRQTLHSVARHERRRKSGT